MSVDSVIAGPEVDMVEVDPVSSSSSTMAIDLNLNLNLGPSFVLELALGRGQGDFPGSFAPVSRQSWPRFEPRMLDGGQEHEQQMSEDHISSNFGRRDLHPLDNAIRALQQPGVDTNINDDATRASRQTNEMRDINDDDGFRTSRQIGVNDDIDDDDDDGFRTSRQIGVNDDIADSIGASRQTSVYADINGDDAIRALRQRDVGVNIDEDEGIRTLRQRDVNVNINENSIGTSQQTSLNAEIDNDDGVRVAPETGVNVDTNHNGNRVARQTDVNTNTNDNDDGIRHSERYQNQYGEEGSSSQTSLQTLRSSRHARYPRRPRHALFAAVRDMVETRETSAGHVSTDDNRVLITIPSATISTPSPIISRLRTPRTQTPSFSRRNDEEDKKIHGSSGGAHFECNICLEMAVEPVVSCCGHLFCWSCIYQWLHFHSSQKECPVCKGFLSDDLITPIYGRGTSEASDRPPGNTPPRPHAHRINDKMQFPETFVHERLIYANNNNPILERSNEIDIIARSDSSQAEISEAEASRSADLILNRLRIAQRLQREHLDERLRLRWRQRMMGRRGSAFRSFAALEAVAAQLLTSSEDHIQMQHPTMEENVEIINERRRDRDGGSGLPTPYSSSSNERLLFSQGIESDLSANVDNNQLHSVVLSSHLVTPQLVIPSDLVTPSAHLMTTSSNSVTSLNLGTSPNTVTLESNQLPLRSLATLIESENAPIGHPSTGDLQQSWRVWHNSASGSFDLEAECFHARKRRRLN